MNPMDTSKIKDVVALHKDITERARVLMLEKNHDYTTGSVDPLANFRYAVLLGVPTRRGILVRIFDKVKRLVTFIELGFCLLHSEKVEDTVIDAVNYLVLWLYSYREDGNKKRCRHYISHIIDHLLYLNHFSGRSN